MHNIIFLPELIRKIQYRDDQSFEHDYRVCLIRNAVTIEVLEAGLGHFKVLTSGSAAQIVSLISLKELYKKLVLHSGIIDIREIIFKS